MDILIRNVEYGSGEFSNYMIEMEVIFNKTTVSLANSIRRVLQSELPCIGFDQKDIKIIENTSTAHNEFITHRVCLLPINQSLQFTGYYDKKTQTRKYQFNDNVDVPLFVLNKQNNSTDTIATKNIIDVMTNDFKVYKTKTESEEPITQYFNKDPYTDSYIQLLILKSNPVHMQFNESPGEHLHLQCIPSIKTAKYHGGFTPIGNVAYKFEQESKEIIDLIYEKHFNQINNERIMKKLTPFNDEKKEEMRKSFYLCDAERIYMKNDSGECNSISITIESIGAQSPSQSIMNAFMVLKIRCIDLLNNIKLTDKSIELNPVKFEIMTAMSDKFSYILKEEDQTMGNLLNDYLNRIDYNSIQNLDNHDFSVHLEKNNESPFFDYSSYRRTHYLENNLQFNMCIAADKPVKFNDILSRTSYSKTEKIMFPYIVGIYKTLQYIIMEIEFLMDKFVKSQESIINNSGELKELIEGPSFTSLDVQYTKKLFYE